MSDRQDIKSELEQLSPYLAKLKSEGLPPPEVPDAYFESLPDDVLIRAKAEESLIGRVRKEQYSSEQKPVAWSEWFNWRPVLALASLLLLAVAVYWFYPFATPGQAGEEMALERLEVEDINNYITQNISEFDMALMLEAEMIDQVSLEGILSDGLPEEVLDEYLDEILEDMDLQDL